MRFLFLCSIAIVPLFFHPSFVAAEENSDASRVDDLIQAITSGDRARVLGLLDDGVDPNRANSDGLTPWVVAHQQGYRELAELLESQGARTGQQPPPLDILLDSSLGKLFNESTAGCAILVSRNGQLVLETNYGMARLDPPQPVASDTIFRIGSVTKQFTAAAILKLQEQGKLSVHDPLSKFLPDFPNGDQITLHHLLTHTSGIANYTAQPLFRLTVMLPVSEEALVKSFEALPAMFEPGERYDYCNTGYFLLGHIIGKVSESTYADYLAQEFFRPLAMNDTGVHRPDLELEREAHGYSMSDRTASPGLDWHMSRAGGAGALYSTVRDLDRWNNALFAGPKSSRSNRSKPPRRQPS
jgi:CubicO group peptidase (beta-lactamase class C family)